MSAASAFTANRAELAALLGRSLPTVDSWVRQGCPVVERGGRGRQWRFNVSDVMQWRIKRAVADAVAKFDTPTGQITKDEADRRRAVAQAITAEVEADETLRSVVAVADAADQVAKEYAAVRAALLGLGARVSEAAAAATSAPAIQELVDAEIITTLEGLTDDAR